MQIAEVKAENWFQAKQAYREYRAAVNEGRATDDDRLALKTYSNILRGLKVIDFFESLRIGGLDERMRPRLAIAPAKAEWCWFRPYFGFVSRTPVFAHTLSGVRRAGEVRIPRDLFGTGLCVKDCRAAVPQIPPQHRPKSLDGYHILWEAKWEAVPADPMLLRRLDGSHLFAVVAQWDLTPVEQAVLRGHYA